MLSLPFNGEHKVKENGNTNCAAQSSDAFEEVKFEDHSVQTDFEDFASSKDVLLSSSMDRILIWGDCSGLSHYTGWQRSTLLYNCCGSSSCWQPDLDWQWKRVQMKMILFLFGRRTCRLLSNQGEDCCCLFFQLEKNRGIQHPRLYFH